MDKLSLWIPVIVALIPALPVYISAIKGRSSRKSIHKTLLRSDMFMLLELARSKGYRTDTMTYHFNEMLDQYKKIGGNSYAEELVDEFTSIPKKN